MGLRSVDAPRERPAPSGFHGHDAHGVDVSMTFVRPTVVVAVKPNCDGCREFISTDRALGDDVDVVVAAEGDDVAWREARGVVIAPQLWRDLEIRSAPFYVLIDPARGLVTGEGSVFSPTQVAAEVARRMAS